MVGFCCGIEVFLVTGNTFIGYFLITVPGMTFSATDTVSACEREKSMFEIGSIPARRFYTMAFNTIGRVARFFVIGFNGGQVIRFMAIVTIDTQRFILQFG